MSFASLEFLLFFAAVLLPTALIDRFLPNRAREIFLLVVSYVFYGYCGWYFCFLLLFVTLSAYFAAGHTEKKSVYLFGIIAPLLLLGIFKYYNFFLTSITALLGTETRTLKLLLPVGISFYTFQAISYVVDAKRGKVEPEKDFIRTALYLSFFPQVLSGPIVRAADLLPQLREGRKISANSLSCGVQIFAFGLLKKMVLADNLALFVNDVYHAPSAFHWTTLVLAAVSYSLQIYFDFSGYSDMAIGCAKCLGYDYKRNFDLPYLSQSVTEFWRRWHISLSTWLRDYLYIPLGGNRKGKVRTYANLFLTFLLGGLWHGADWTFVFWGALNGVALCVDKFLTNRKGNSLVRALRISGTFLFITLTWVFFRADTFEEAASILRGVITLQNGIVQPFAWTFAAIAVLLAATLYAARKAKRSGETWIGSCYPMLDLTTIKGLTIFFIELGAILGLTFTGEQPFVYFQF